MSKVKCPYCWIETETNHDLSDGYDESEKHECFCHNCGKGFVFTVHIILHFESEQADCLNGKPHNYEKTITFPVELSKMRCSMCGDERNMTESERIGFGIGTVKDYLDSLLKK